MRPPVTPAGSARFAHNPPPPSPHGHVRKNRAGGVGINHCDKQCDPRRKGIRQPDGSPRWDRRDQTIIAIAPDSCSIPRAQPDYETLSFFHRSRSCAAVRAGVFPRNGSSGKTSIARPVNSLCLARGGSESKPVGVELVSETQRQLEVFPFPIGRGRINCWSK